LNWSEASWRCCAQPAIWKSGRWEHRKAELRRQNAKVKLQKE
jgi:hypothetical protein